MLSAVLTAAINRKRREKEKELRNKAANGHYKPSSKISIFTFYFGYMKEI